MNADAKGLPFVFHYSLLIKGMQFATSVCNTQPPHAISATNTINTAVCYFTQHNTISVLF